MRAARAGGGGAARWGWGWFVSPEGRRCKAVSDGPCDGEGVRGVPCRRVWRGRFMMSPEGVLCMVGGVPWRGAFVGISSAPQSGTGSAVLALAGLGIGSVPQGRAGVRRVPCGGSAVSPVAVQRVSALPDGRVGVQCAGAGGGTYGCTGDLWWPLEPCQAQQLGDYTCPPAVLTPK